MQLPEIQSGNQTSRPRTDNAQWRADKFIQPQKLVGSVYGWAVFVFPTHHQGRMNMGDLEYNLDN